MARDDIHPQLLRNIRNCREKLLTGRVISIDPSSGSRTSSPAYAIYRQGKLVAADSIKLPGILLNNAKYTPHRLRYISQILHDLGEFDVLAIEWFDPEPNHKTNHKSMQQLNQSVGCISGAVQWDRVIPVFGFEWTRHRPRDYVKSDIDDAVHIGKWVIELASKME